MVFFRCAFAALLMSAASVASAQDEAASKKRLALMEQTVAALAAKSDQIKDQRDLTFVAKPLLRYSDPTRGLTELNTLLDASVWRLGERGRPTALVTFEIYRTSDEAGILAYEFASLTESRFSLAHAQVEKVAWDATASALTTRPLPDAPAPAGTAAARLAQMRQLARRFTVREKLKGEDIQCRLLAQPIDRYESPDKEIVDGALFAFANGTNPEIGLLVECDEKGWSYGTVRLSAAESSVALDGREVAAYPLVDSLKREGSYVSSSHPIELPK